MSLPWLRQHQAEMVRPQGKENVGQSLSKPAPATSQLSQHSDSTKKERRSLSQPQQPDDATADQATRRMGCNFQSRPGRLVQPQQQHMNAPAGGRTRQPSIQQHSRAAVRPAGSLSPVASAAQELSGPLHKPAGPLPDGGDNMAAESLENARHASGQIHGSQPRAEMQAPARAAQTDAGHERQQQAMQQPGLGLGHAADQPSDHAADRKKRQGVRHARRPSDIMRDFDGPQQPLWTAAAPSDPAQPNAAKRQGAATASEDNPGGRLHDAVACRVAPARKQQASHVASQRPAAGMSAGHPSRPKGQRLPGSQRGRGSRAPSVAGGRSNTAMSLPGNTKRSKVGDRSKQHLIVRCCGVNTLHLPA